MYGAARPSARRSAVTARPISTYTAWLTGRMKGAAPRRCWWGRYNGGIHRRQDAVLHRSLDGARSAVGCGMQAQGLKPKSRYVLVGLDVFTILPVAAQFCFRFFQAGVGPMLSLNSAGFGPSRYKVTAFPSWTSLKFWLPLEPGVVLLLS